MLRVWLTAVLVVLVAFAAMTCSGSIDIPDSGGDGDADSDSDSDSDCPGGCPAGQSCRDGRCVSACSGPSDCTAPYECCDGACVNTRDDPSNCGSCGADCSPRGDACVGGTCSCNGAVACATPLICCGSDGCVDGQSHPEHCGRCNNPCSGTCIDGSCEACTADAHEAGGGNTCADAISMGDLGDDGSTQVVTGNLYPDGDQDCFWFTATDSADSDCDSFHVDIRLTSNPGDVFALSVYRGSCESPECPATPYEQYSWATDFFSDGDPGGECPCRAESAEGTHECSDNTAVFRFCISLAAGAVPGCEWYEVEVSNGVYTTG